MNAIGIATLPGQASAARAATAPCLVLNPRSFEVATSRLAARAVALATAHGAEVLEAQDPQQIASGLDRVLAQGPRRLFVLAGDGTVQAIVDHLARRPAGTTLPELLILGGGRTNLTAADLNGGQSALRKLESALLMAGADPGASRLQYRHTLVIEQPPAPPRHGFFVAAAMVDSLIRHCHEHRDAGPGSLRKARYSTAWRMLHEAVPAMLGRPPYEFPQLEVEIPGCGRLRGPARLLLATTLVHDRWYFHPYAARGDGALRVTAVSAQARGFWRRLPRLLTGRFSPAMTPDQGYLSGRCGSFVVTGLDGYTLDGQSFATDPGRPVAVRIGPRMTFLAP